MRLLLDTHVWIWALAAPERLARRARVALEDPDNELWLSAMSVWEAHLLAERGRILVDGPAGEAIQRALVQFPVRDAPITRAVAMASRSVSLAHDDLADRFIVATAAVEGLRLLTADVRLLRARACATLSARR